MRYGLYENNWINKVFSAQYQRSNWQFIFTAFTRVLFTHKQMCSHVCIHNVESSRGVLHASLHFTNVLVVYIRLYIYMKCNSIKFIQIFRWKCIMRKTFWCRRSSSSSIYNRKASSDVYSVQKYIYQKLFDVIQGHIYRHMCFP